MSERAPSGQPYMPWFAVDYENDTFDLDPEADLIYRRMLDLYWRSGCRMKRENLARKLRLDNGWFNGWFNQVEPFWTTDGDGYLHNERAQREFDIAMEKTEKARKASLAGVEARRIKRLRQAVEKQQTNGATDGSTIGATNGATDEATDAQQVREGKDLEEPDGSSPPKPPAEAVGSNTQIATELIDFLNTSAGTSYRARVGGKPTKSTGLASQLLSSGYTADDVRQVIERKCAEWLGTEQAKYLRPETLFRASKFEGYLGQVGTALAPARARDGPLNGHANPEFNPITGAPMHGKPLGHITRSALAAFAAADAIDAQRAADADARGGNRHDPVAEPETGLFATGRRDGDGDGGDGR